MKDPIFFNNFCHALHNVAQQVKNLPAMRETWVRPLGWEDPLQKGTATHSSVLPGEFHSLYGVAKSRTHLSNQDFPERSVGKVSACTAGDPGQKPGSGRSAEGKGYPLQYSWASLVAQLVRICPQGGRPGFDPWVGKIPWRRERLPTPVFWPREFHGLQSPQGHKESDTTERLSLSLHFHTIEGVIK